MLGGVSTAVRNARGKGLHLVKASKVVREQERKPNQRRKSVNGLKKISIPIKALTNYELVKYAKQLKIPHSRGVYMKDALPKNPLLNESAIVNLDNASGEGTHWVCYKKIGNNEYYFDSFGNLRPPTEHKIF